LQYIKKTGKNTPDLPSVTE